MTILNGIGNLVDEWLELEPKGKPPYYRHKAAANTLSRRRTSIVGTWEFLEASYNRIESNWRDAHYSNPSRKNWRWKRHLDFAPNNTSEEVRLERTIAKTCGDDWSNQMPVESGLISPNKGKVAIDLVHREGPSSYSLIELKVRTNNPLYAAIEILQYGLLFVWSRDNWAQLGYVIQKQPVLAATAIMLEVLAPADYYLDYDLRNLEALLNDELGKLGEQRGLALGFGFTKFGSKYETGCSPERIGSAIISRCPVYVD